MKKEQDSETNSFCYLKWVFGPGVEKMMQIGGTKSPIFKIFFFLGQKSAKGKKFEFADWNVGKNWRCILIIKVMCEFFYIIYYAENCVLR